MQQELETPREGDRRPFDEIMAAGPPGNPIEFSRPQMLRGRRDDVCLYDAATENLETASNVLFRDYGGEDGDTRVQRAYWPLPYKKRIKTIMGHVEICVVLQRHRKNGVTNDADNHFDDSSSEEEDDYEEDIIFQSTEQLVAVKVNYSDRMEQLRNKHAEDPLKEIAAMQLIGNDHPNVLGCDEVLFDGNNLNVVLPFCDSGDLFQLLQDTSSRKSKSDDASAPSTPGLREIESRYWFRQVVAGLRHLANVGVCHRDLSPENIMINAGHALIIDMGMCLRIPYSEKENPLAVTDKSSGTTQRRLMSPQGTCGKLPYMSPEIYRNKDPFDGSAVDIWTAGTILFCMVTGNRSYERPHSSDPQFYWMTRGLDQLLRDWGVDLSDTGVHLLKNMLQINPRLRLTLEEIESHPWFSMSSVEEEHEAVAIVGNNNGGGDDDDDDFDDMNLDF